jgi:osmoprotectant transport system permease protein
VNYVLRHPGDIAWRTLEHVELVAIALVIACAIALPLGVLVARKRRIGDAILAALNIVYTIPSLAIFALLIPLFGIGTFTAIVALVAYSQMILVRNVAVGLRGVPFALTDAARGLGMSAWQSLWRVELPQALPVILGGVRLATITLIALATLASWINAGGLGTLILYGLQHDDPIRALAGSVIAALLAIAANTGFHVLERRTAIERGGH